MYYIFTLVHLNYSNFNKCHLHKFSSTYTFHKKAKDLILCKFAYPFVIKYSIFILIFFIFALFFFFNFYLQ